MNSSDMFDSLSETKEEIVEEKDKTISPFDIVNSIYHTKDFVLNEETNKFYIMYVINRALSMGQDTIFFAAEMNELSHLTNNMHHDFLNGIVRKRKRYNKWIKSEKSEYVDIIKFYMKCSAVKAKVYMSLLNEQQLKELKERYTKVYKN